MNGEAVKEIERIAREATEPKAQEVNGHWYAARQLFPLLPPAVPSPGALVVHTLSGLVDYIVSHNRLAPRLRSWSFEPAVLLPFYPAPGFLPRGRSQAHLGAEPASASRAAGSGLSLHRSKTLF